MSLNARFLSTATAVACSLVALAPEARASFVGPDLQAIDVSSVAGTPAGKTTLRYFARFNHADDRLISIGASNGTSVGGVIFFQSSAPSAGDTPPDTQNFGVHPSLMFDSWVTAAGAATPPHPTDTLLDPNWDTDQFNLQSAVVGGWYDSTPDSPTAPDAQGRVLVAQITFNATVDSSTGVGINGPLTVYYRNGATGECEPVVAQWGGKFIPPDAVVLVKLEATRVAQGVRLSWITASEIDCAEFQVRRCALADGACAIEAHQELDGIGRIGCANVPAGGSYVAVDTTALADAGYSYLLQEIETTGGVRHYGPLRLPSDALAATWNPETGATTVVRRPPVEDPIDEPPVRDVAVKSGCAAAEGDASSSVAWLFGAALLVALRWRRGRTALGSLAFAAALTTGAGDAAAGDGGSTPATCFGDVNGDGVVNFDDVEAIKAAWGTANGFGPADLVQDGVVDDADLAACLCAFGDCPVVAQPKIRGVVTDVNGMPIQGAGISHAGGQTNTNLAGAYEIDRPGGGTIIEIMKDGFSSDSINVGALADAAGLPSTADLTLNATLKPLCVALTIPDDGNSDMIICGGLSITINASQFQDPSGEPGQPYIGPMNVELVTLNPQNPVTPDYINAFPGLFTAFDVNGIAAILQTFGLFEANFYQPNLDGSNGPRLELLPDQSVGFVLSTDIGLDTSRCPTGEPPTLWLFDPTSGQWIESQTGTSVNLVDNFCIYDGAVNHLSWWNCDRPLNTRHCHTGRVVDTLGNGVAGAYVYARGIDYAGASYGYSDPNGFFCVDVRADSFVEIVAQYYDNNTLIQSQILGVATGPAGHSCFAPPPDDCTPLGEDLVVERSCVTGVVIDGNTGNGIEGATVVSNTGASTVSGLGGLYCLEVVGGTQVILTAFASGLTFGPVVVQADDAAGTCGPPPSGCTAAPTLVGTGPGYTVCMSGAVDTCWLKECSDRGFSTCGTVEFRQPWTDMTFNFTNQPPVLASATIQADGSFCVSGLPPGISVDVYAFFFFDKSIGCGSDFTPALPGLVTPALPGSCPPGSDDGGVGDAGTLPGGGSAGECVAVSAAPIRCREGSFENPQFCGFGDTGDGDTDGCLFEGDSCSTDFDCCSGFCSGGLCAGQPE